MPDVTFPTGVPAVAAEIVAGDGLSLGQAGKLLPAHRGDGTATASSVWRWATVGAKAPDGRVVRLEVARFGGRFLTSRAALTRFAAALTATAATEGDAAGETARRAPAARRKAAESAAKKLAAMGA